MNIKSLMPVPLQLFAGTLAAAVTVPAAASQQQPTSMTALGFSVATIVCSVMATGLINNYVNRRTLRKTESETRKIDVQTYAIELETSARILSQKNKEIEELTGNINKLKVEVEGLIEEIATLKAENAQLLMVISRKIGKTADIRDLMKNFFEYLEGSPADEEGENSRQC